MNHELILVRRRSRCSAAIAAALAIVAIPQEDAIGRLVALRAAAQNKDVVAEIRRLKLQVLREPVLVQIVRVEAEAGRLPAARAVIGMLGNSLYARHAALELARATRQKADVEQAVAMFRQPPEGSELVNIADAYARAGDVRSAVAAAQKVKDFDRADALCRIARARAPYCAAIVYSALASISTASTPCSTIGLISSSRGL